MHSAMDCAAHVDTLCCVFVFFVCVYQSLLTIIIFCVCCLYYVVFCCVTMLEIDVVATLNYNFFSIEFDCTSHSKL